MIDRLLIAKALAKAAKDVLAAKSSVATEDLEYYSQLLKEVRGRLNAQVAEANGKTIGVQSFEATFVCKLEKDDDFSFRVVAKDKASGFSGDFAVPGRFGIEKIAAPWQNYHKSLPRERKKACTDFDKKAFAEAKKTYAELTSTSDRAVRISFFLKRNGR